MRLHLRVRQCWSLLTRIHRLDVRRHNFIVSLFCICVFGDQALVTFLENVEHCLFPFFSGESEISAFRSDSAHNNKFVLLVALEPTDSQCG